MRQPGKDDRSGSGGPALSADESLELLDVAQEAGRFGIFEWQVQAGTFRLSPQCLLLYGLSEFDGRYETWLKCIFREDVARFVDLMESAFSEHAHEVQAEFRIVQPTDRALKWIEVRSVIFYEPQLRAVRVVGVIVNVTDRKRAAAQLRAFTETLEERVKERTRALEDENQARKKAEEALRQAQKMEAVGQLTGGVAHDFNNLLTIIQGGVEMIGRQIRSLEASPATSKMLRGTEMAQEGVRRAAEVTRRLLAFARQQPLSPASVDPNKLVADICELLRRTLGETISLETVLAGGLWRTYVDANQLESTLLNLGVNARDALPNGGKVTIETANCHLDEAYVSKLIEPVKVGQYIMIAVTDTGIGMDDTTIERAFEPFFTTKSVGKGTGLGLSQVYGFVRQSAGHVRIYSELGQGTTVKIYLPRYVGADQHADDPRRHRSAHEIRGAETILIVEDDDSLRASTVELLSDLGYGVVAAANGPAALELLDRDRDIDLLFTDIVMPGGMNGRQLADEAVRRRPELRVLFTTGYTRNAIVHHGRLDPDVEMISKPFTSEDLGARIRALLDR